MLLHKVYVYYNYDTSTADYEDIYRLDLTMKNSDGVSLYDKFPGGFYESIIAHDGVRSALRLLDYQRGTRISANNKNFEIEGVVFSDANFQEFFGSKINANITHLNPNEILISAECALRIFGSIDVVGNEVRIGRIPYVIREVLSMAKHSHLEFNILLPLANSPQWSTFEKSTDLAHNYYYYYLKKETHLSTNSLRGIIQSSFESLIRSDEASFDFDIGFTPLDRIYLKRGGLGLALSVGNIQNISFLFLLSVLMIALIISNFTLGALSMNRKTLMDYYVRRVLGASFTHTFRLQVEKFLLPLIVSCVLAMALFYLFVESIYGIMDVDFIRYGIIDTIVIMSIALVILGLLVTFYLSFRVQKELIIGKERLVKSSSNASRLQNVFLTIQTTLSMSFILFSLTLFNQIDFQKNFDSGFNASNLITLDFPPSSPSDSLNRTFTAFRDELMKISGVENFTNSSIIPGVPYNWEVRTIKVQGNEQTYSSQLMIIDDQFVETYGMTFLAGENLDSRLSKDNTAENVIVNEAFVKHIGLSLPESAIGVKFTMFSNRDQRIIKAVVKDFTQVSLKSRVKPMVMFLNPIVGRHITLRTAGVVENPLNQVEQSWNYYFPNSEFRYHFLRQNLETTYNNEITLLRTASISGVICICLAIIGLIAMTDLSIQSKRKEISLRKILGAMPLSLLRSLLKENLLMLTISSVVSFSVVVYLTRLWTSQFVYHFEFEFHEYLLLLATLGVSILLLITWRFRVAIMVNPIDHLRYE